MQGLSASMTRRGRFAMQKVEGSSPFIRSSKARMPIVVKATNPTWRTSSWLSRPLSARRACERTAPSACAPPAIPSLTSRAVRSSRGALVARFREFPMG